jgi:hypothetical protein
VSAQDVDDLRILHLREILMELADCPEVGRRGEANDFVAELANRGQAPVSNSARTFMLSFASR